MSEKKAKELRREEAAKKVSVNINIMAMEDGTMQITGIPKNPFMTMDIMGTAIKIMAGKLYQTAQAAESKIMPAKTPIVGLDGRRLN